MGREIRRVPAGWEHPRDNQGNFLPLYDRDYATEAAQWVTDFELWRKGTHPDQIRIPAATAPYIYFWEWADGPPMNGAYRPFWAEEDATHFQVYETVSEGTPTSPVFASLDELQAWLIGQGYAAEAAEAFTQKGWAPSLLIRDGVVHSEIHASAVSS